MGAELTPSQSGSRPKSGRLRAGLLVLVTAIVCGLTLFPRNAELSHNELDMASSAGTSGSLPQCVPPIAPGVTPPSPINIFAPLTINEIVQVQSWLEAPEQNLNLTRTRPTAGDDGRVAQAGDESIYIIEAYMPDKADALLYLDKEGDRPKRYARVTLHHGAAAVPVVKDYLVGPLDLLSSARDRVTMRQLTEIYDHPDIPYNARGASWFGASEMATIAAKIMVPYQDVMMDLFGGIAVGLPNDTLVFRASGPFSFDGSFRRMWTSWKRNIPGGYLLPVNLFQYLDMSGSDPQEWKVLKVVYNHQVFNSTAAFLDAYYAGTLKRLPTIPPDYDTTWATRSRKEVLDRSPAARLNNSTRSKKMDGRDLDHLPGPRSVSFAGLRFRVDQKTQYVSWMGWGMYFSFDRDMGLSLWDIRLKGERLIYQLAPQEAIAQYAGDDPLQSTTAWQDRHFGMGAATRSLLEGYDCPHEAVYLPATTYSAGGIIVRDKAICIFEQDTGRPITRHMGYVNGEAGAVKGYMLTVRTISTVGNYDYLFDYMFQLDGTIEVRTSASGYLQGGYWEPLQEAYGGRIRDYSMGSLHDHVINYKVDFDIAGTANSLLETRTVQEQVTPPWLAGAASDDPIDDWGTTHLQQVLKKRYIDSEDDARLSYVANAQGHYAIVNQDMRNAWGYPRGYAIHAGYSPIVNTVLNSKRLLHNANWAKYNLAVSVRKDTEPSSSSMWNMNLPGKPTVDFHSFFNGENLNQSDLVAWINIGMHHLPQAEDSPTTKTNIAQSSFILTPLNYFDADISLEMRNAVVLKMPTVAGDKFDFDDYGVNLGYTCVPQTPAKFEYGFDQSFDARGRLRAAVDAEEERKDAEGYHRIKL